MPGDEHICVQALDLSDHAVAKSHVVDNSVLHRDIIPRDDHDPGFQRRASKWRFPSCRWGGTGGHLNDGIVKSLPTVAPGELEVTSTTTSQGSAAPFQPFAIHSYSTLFLSKILPRNKPLRRIKPKLYYNYTICTEYTSNLSPSKCRSSLKQLLSSGPQSDHLWSVHHLVSSPPPSSDRSLPLRRSRMASRRSTEQYRMRPWLVSTQEVRCIAYHSACRPTD